MKSNASLYQIQVTTARGENVLVGPRSDSTEFLYPLVETINKAVSLGKEADWRDAHIVPVSALTN